MKTCATCIAWHKIGTSHAPRRLCYDTGPVILPPGEEGQCRATGPREDFRWPLTGAGDWCASHRGVPGPEPVTPPKTFDAETPAPVKTGHGEGNGEPAHAVECAASQSTAQQPEPSPEGPAPAGAEAGATTPPTAGRSSPRRASTRRAAP